MLTEAPASYRPSTCGRATPTLRSKAEPWNELMLHDVLSRSPRVQRTTARKGHRTRGVPNDYHCPVSRYSCIDRAATRPAPMAKMTVAAPLTISPPANTPRLLVRDVSSSATM
ncbi:hypothetical protein Enr13x_22670 [Stieleria neptunia]|uniref:Uncharacterized protein n=1 Tax=Stieleria neptunia TaxID=2527979 RepID=A0A518HNK6_9BACT|nr:hypothetical protein Enr13x_22670 [Stieleria neptunia]